MQAVIRRRTLPMAPPPPPPTVGFWQTVLSVLAAFFGVQSGRNRQRDFSRGKPWMFVLIAVVMTAALILMLRGVVALVLRDAGA